MVVRRRRIVDVRVTARKEPKFRFPLLFKVVEDTGAIVEDDDDAPTRGAAVMAGAVLSPASSAESAPDRGMRLSRLSSSSWVSIMVNVPSGNVSGSAPVS